MLFIAKRFICTNCYKVKNTQKRNLKPVACVPAWFAFDQPIDEAGNGCIEYPLIEIADRAKQIRARHQPSPHNPFLKSNLRTNKQHEIH
jgi:hypothetical protein